MCTKKQPDKSFSPRVRVTDIWTKKAYKTSNIQHDFMWNNSYEQSSDFSIVLNDLEKDSQYIIKIQTIDNKKANIIMSSVDDLVKDKDKPIK